MNTQKLGSGKRALITGASSGIGEALAECFAKDGYSLVLVARSKDKLNTLAGALTAKFNVDVTVASADLSKNGAAGKLKKTLDAGNTEVDALVNNAGVLEQGAFAGMKPQRHMDLIRLNVSGLTDMIAQFLPSMLEQGHGRILNVASIAAFQPIPALATYAATKAYVLSLTESLSEELRNSGVSVTALCPGITATSMFSSVKEANDRIAKLPGFLVGDVRKVAEEGYDACMKGEVIRVPGRINLATTLAARATPKWLLRRIAGTIGRRTL